MVAMVVVGAAVVEVIGGGAVVEVVLVLLRAVDALV
jgi:hypothetical protein